MAALAPRPAHATIASSILIDEGSGRIISAYRPNARHAPASLTKMMTLYLTFEALRRGQITLHTRVRVSFHAASRPPSKIYLRAGQVVTVQQLILAMTVHSANDAATAMGEFLGRGSESRFAQLMTITAHRLGMRSTVFRNASGLPAGNYTTAHDMALLARTIHLRFPGYSRYFARRYFRWGARTYLNTNRLLHTRREVTGMKTGYTRAAGFNLVATATYGRKKIILVVLGGRTSGQRYSQAELLLAMARSGVPARGRVIQVAQDRTPPIRTKTAQTKAVETKTAQTKTAEATPHRGRHQVAARKEAKKAAPRAEVAAARAPISRSSHGFSLIARAEASTRVRIPSQRAVHRVIRSIKRYGVQIGAFRHFAEARSIAKKAYYRVPGAYRSGSMRIAVIKKRHGRRTHYLARLLGFNHTAARRTCRYLKRRGIRHCRTLSYSVRTASIAAPATHAVYRHAARAQAKPAPIQVARAKITRRAPAGRALAGRTVANKDSLGYGLQIGVYRSFKRAAWVARAVHNKVKPSVRQRTKVSVVRLKKHRHVVFAARIEGFRAEARAARVCNRLDRKGYSCDTIAYDL